MINFVAQNVRSLRLVLTDKYLEPEEVESTNILDKKKKCIYRLVFVDDALTDDIRNVLRAAVDVRSNYTSENFKVSAFSFLRTKTKNRPSRSIKTTN